MRFAQIRRFDVANGPGIRTSIFVTGCNLNCPGCFNKIYSDFNYGKLWTKFYENQLIEFLNNPHVSGLSVLGGEPLAQDEQLDELLSRVKIEIKKPVWLWTGFVFEQLNLKQLQTLKFVDVLIDGPFIIAKKDLNLKFRGSSNRRIIDLNLTRKLNKITFADF